MVGVQTTNNRVSSDFNFQILYFLYNSNLLYIFNKCNFTNLYFNKLTFCETYSNEPLCFKTKFTFQILII